MHNKSLIRQRCRIATDDPSTAPRRIATGGLARVRKPSHILSAPPVTSPPAPSQAKSRAASPMPGPLNLQFAPFTASPEGVLVLFCEEGVKLGSDARKLIQATGDLVVRAAAADRFKGKSGSALDIVAPAGLSVSRLIVIGVGKGRDLKPQDFVKLGRISMGQSPGAHTG